MKAYYEQSLAHIEKDIQTLYQRFATDNGLDMVAAQRLLMGSEYRVWRMDLQEYVAKINATGDKELLRELNTLAMRSRITRLDALRSETIKEMIQLSEKTERAMSRFLPSAYKDFYYRGLYEIGKTRGIRSAAGVVDGKRIEAVLRMPWSGKNYSERIWHNNAKLGETIQKSIVAAAHRGVPVSDMVRDVRERMGVGTSDATRLVRTELNYVQNQAALDSIKDAGMAYYRFIATLDNRTTPICRSKDGEVFAVDDAEPGTNMPPLHPRCRSIISGSLYAEHKPRKGTRIARDEHGKNVFVPSYMKYDDWKTVFVDKKQTMSEWNKRKVFDFKKERLEKTVEAAKASMAMAETALANIPNQSYSGIWRNDVSLEDWEAKAGSIPAKLKYLDDQITAGNAVAMFESLKSDLAEFDALGRKYAEKKAALRKAKKALDKAEDELYMHLHSETHDPSKLAFSQKRKDAAYWFKQRAEADKVLRDATGKLWQKLTAKEREALYEYTSGSGGFNRPLAGFEKPWTEAGSGWEEKYRKGVGKVWINYEGRGSQIRTMTEVLSKSSYDFDIWLQRGCNNEAMDSFFGLKRGRFESLSHEELQWYLGHTQTMENFISTAGCKGDGFNGNVVLNIYAPRGTNMIYAEPFSHHGAGEKLAWDGISGQKTFGSEFEVIIQRGAKYRVTKIERKGWKTYIDLEIHPEEGYNLYQQDVAEWKGSRKNFKGQTISIEDEKKGV